MKKFFIGIAMTLAMIAGLSSCSCQDAAKVTTSIIEWSLIASAEGQGEVQVAYPSGGLTVKGDAYAEVNTFSDSLFSMTNAPTLDAVLAAPANYTEEQVAFAQTVNEQFNSAFDVKVLEGSWAVDINGYVKQPQTGFYVVISKHWPVEE